MKRCPICGNRVRPNEPCPRCGSKERKPPKKKRKKGIGRREAPDRKRNGDTSVLQRVRSALAR